MHVGIKCEGHILKEFERKYDLKVVASGFAVSESHPFLSASPDGIIDNETIVEVIRRYISRMVKVIKQQWVGLVFINRMEVNYRLTRIMLIITKFSNRCFVLRVMHATLLFQVTLRHTLTPLDLIDLLLESSVTKA